MTSRTRARAALLGWATFAMIGVFSPESRALGLANDYLKRHEAGAASLITAGTIPKTVVKLVAMPDDELDLTLAALARAVWAREARTETTELLDALIAQGDARAAAIAATLLVELSDQVPQSPFLATKELLRYPEAWCDRAAALLAHPDPVVQAAAEWSLALRVKEQDSSTRMLKEMLHRSPTPPAWYAKWKSRGARHDLDDDYARQLVQLGRHLSVIGVGKAIADHETSMKRLLADPGTRADAEKIKLHDQLLAQAKVLCAASQADLVKAHVAYLAVRRAGRAVIVASRADFPAEGFVFYTNGAMNGGDWNVNMPVTNGTNTPVGELYVKRGADPTTVAEPLIKGRLGGGSIRGIDLAWEGDRVLFSFWRQPLDPKSRTGWDDTRNAGIHELVLATGEVKTLTAPVGYNDIEPCYLPDGGFVFSSDRSSYGNQCAGPILQNKRCTTLYRFDPRRSPEPVAISNNKDFDRHASVLNDGSIVFMHWEYQERSLLTSQNVWRCRPDGTNMDAYFKQHITVPYSIREARQAPDSELHVATYQGHHDGPNGPLMLFNPSLGINNERAMWSLTPGCASIEGGEGALAKQVVPDGGVKNRGGSYINPFPMSDKVFLVGHDPSRTEAEFALYYIDVWGNRELLHKDDDFSSFQPYALRARKRPPVVADTVKPDVTHATAFLEDVYRDLPGVKRGDVKWLRMSQSLMLPAPVYTEDERAVDSRSDYNHLHYLPGDATARHFGYWQWSPSRMIGLVKVEDDGSAYFKVPAGTPVYLQALDENLTEVRRMRTSFTLQRGEFRSCTGCHESRLETVGNRRPLPKATLAKGPQTPVPPPWGETTVLDFEKHIMPLLDRHCVSCHGKESPAGGLELTSRKIGGFAQSYRAMFGLKPDDPTPVTEVDWHLVLNPDAKDAAYTDKKQAQAAQIAFQTNKAPGQLILISDRQGDSSITQPRQFGSGVSKLTRTLLDDPKHRDAVRAKITPDEWLMFVTWIDFNAVYHGTLFDVSHYNKTKTFTRVPYDIPSVWVPGDVNPTFHNKALNRR